MRDEGGGKSSFRDRVREHWLLAVTIGAVVATSTYGILEVMVITPKSDRIDALEKDANKYQSEIIRLEGKVSDGLGRNAELEDALKEPDNDNRVAQLTVEIENLREENEVLTRDKEEILVRLAEAEAGKTIRLVLFNTEYIEKLGEPRAYLWNVTDGYLRSLERFEQEVLDEWELGPASMSDIVEDLLLRVRDYEKGLAVAELLFHCHEHELPENTISHLELFSEDAVRVAMVIENGWPEGSEKDLFREQVAGRLRQLRARIVSFGEGVSLSQIE